MKWLLVLYFCQVMTNRNEKILLVLGGPTASGKTALAIRLAQHFNTAIISADSRQFYREMSIGTAKPDEEELALVPHHFINSVSIHSAYNVGDFERDALALLEQLYENHQIVLLVGGSGLYVKALCEGLDEFPETPIAIREAWEVFYQEHGLQALQEALRKADPAYYKLVDLQNPHRLIRALAVCQASGKPFSSFRKGTKAPRLFRPVFIELGWDRAALYQRIDARVEQMMAKGLLQEVKSLLPYRALPALQTVGYQELFAYFDGTCSLEAAIAQIQQNSRRYAKRQLTWSRRDGYWKHFHPSEWEGLLAYLALAIDRSVTLEETQIEAEDGTWTELALCVQGNPVIQQAYRFGRKGFYTRAPHAVVAPCTEDLLAELPHWLEHELAYRATAKQ